MKERVKVVLVWEKRWNEGEGVLNFAELCRELGISRQVGYDGSLAELPAQSTIGEVLRRRRLTMPRCLKRVRATQAGDATFRRVTGPNATWCVDLKRPLPDARCALTIPDSLPRR